MAGKTISDPSDRKAKDVKDGHSRRWAVRAGHARSALVIVPFWLALVMFTASACGLLANSLPGVVALDQPRTLIVAATFGATLIFMAVSVLVPALPASPLRRRARRVLEYTRVRARWLVSTALGLVGISRRRLVATVAAGVLAAFLSHIAGAILKGIPELAASVPATDARYEAVSLTPDWVSPVFFAIASPGWEELVYRGMLLGVVAVVSASASNRWLRVTVVGVALLATSLWFGAGHVHWSMLNAVSASVGGMLFGGVAITTRSLWGCVIGHALYNATSFIL